MSGLSETSIDKELATCDPVWQQLRKEAEAIVESEATVAGFVHANILSQNRLEDAIICRLGQRLAHPVMGAELIVAAFQEMTEQYCELSDYIRADIAAVRERDPACDRFIDPVLYFKGFHAIQTHRFANALWKEGRQEFALYLQSRSSEVFQTDIHPQVPLGRGVFIDHGTGVVVGMTAVIEDDVSILQDVTLGGTGKGEEDRHPKVRRGVLIGAGAKVLGNIEIGECSKVAAGSVVLHSVPPNTTVAGVPAKVVGQPGVSEPSRTMDHSI